MSSPSSEDLQVPGVESERSLAKHLPAAIALILFFLLFALLYGRVIIQNDGISYYALTLSLVHDGDFDLENQVPWLREVHVARNPETGKIGCMYSCGFGVLYAPFLYASETLGDWIPSFGRWRPYPQNVRFPFTDALGIFAGSVLLGFLSVVMAWAVLSKKYGVSDGTALFFAVGAFVGTPLIFYVFAVPSFVHASDSFLMALIFFLAVMRNPLQIRKVRLRNILLGTALAFSIMLRNINVFIIFPVAFSLLFLERKEGWKRMAITCIEIFAGALPVAVFHANYNLHQYGSWIATGYPVKMNQQILEENVGTLIRFYEILFHPSAGMFVWAPVTALAFVGLVIGAFKRHHEAILALLIVATVIFVLRFFGWLYAGESFGQRLLTHLYIFWVVGLVEAWLVRKHLTKWIAGVCILWTFLLFNAYYINAVSPEGRRIMHHEEDEQGHTPLEMLQHSAKDYRKAKEAGQIGNPVSFWFTRLGTRPFPTLQYILRQGVSDQPDAQH